MLIVHDIRLQGIEEDGYPIDIEYTASNLEDYITLAKIAQSLTISHLKDEQHSLTVFKDVVGYGDGKFFDSRLTVLISNSEIQLL